MEASKKRPAAESPVIVKKYPNRRLYDTQTSAYITLEELCQRVKTGEEFKVVDAKTNQDLTNQILTQIILEQEIKGASLLPTEFLRSAIRFYDNKMNNVFQQYLDASMKNFMANQERVQQLFSRRFEAMPDAKSGLGQLEEMTRQNMAQGAQLIEKTIQLFSPFGGMFTGKPEADAQEEVDEVRVAAAKRKRR